jgi:hypothetical protein
MKKSIFILSSISFMTGMMFTSCLSSAEKVENAEKNVLEAKQDVVLAKQELNQALVDSIQQYKKEIDVKITSNEKKIAEFRSKIAKETKESKAKYEKLIADLEKKNQEMKYKLNNYKEEGQDNWTKFKSEFNHDMNELGLAFKDLTVKNTN